MQAGRLELLFTEKTLVRVRARAGTLTNCTLFIFYSYFFLMILKGWFLQFYERENDTAVIRQENLQIQVWSREEVWFLVSGSILLLPPLPQHTRFG